MKIVKVIFIALFHWHNDVMVERSLTPTMNLYYPLENSLLMVLHHTMTNCLRENESIEMYYDISQRESA